MTAELLVIAAFGLAGAVLIRLSQYVLPEFYFASGSLFVGRPEVKWKAILFRLAIPFAAGLVIALALSEHQYRAASASGALAWFLVLWPIFWAPAVMVPPIERGTKWIVALWAFFWAAFAVVPLSGVALMTWIDGVLNDPGSEWWELQVAGYLFLLLPVGLVALLLGRLADRNVTFFSDEPEDDEFEYETYDDDYDYSADEDTGARPWLAPAPWQVTSALLSVALTPVVLLGILIAILRRGAGRGRPL